MIVVTSFALLACGGGEENNTPPTNTVPNPAPPPAPVPADTIPPTVVLTAPAAASSVSGTVTIAANASDNVGVVGVQFKLNGNNLGAEDTSAPYSMMWDTTQYANASYTLTAVARDAAGNSTTSVASMLTVANNALPPTDTMPPTVMLTAPAAASRVTGTVTIAANASDNVGVVGVQFKLNNNNLGAEDTTAPYSLNWDTTQYANAGYTLTAVARDAAGHSAAATAILVTVANAPPAPLPPPSADNSVTLSSAQLQTERPISIARVFRRGDVSQFVQALVNNTPVLTQTDVKNRWPDGSVKFAIVSFVVPSIPASGSVTVTFVNQTTGNNTGFLTQAQMLDPAFNFDAVIEMSGANLRAVRARQMLENGHFRYWLQGPVVTAVIIEDRSTARRYDVDFGDGSRVLHPIIEAWFYPRGNHVELGYSVENIWASSNVNTSMRDQSYSVMLKAGMNNPNTVFSQPSFNHIGRTRWHRRAWINPPTPLNMNHNSKYWVATKAIPNYDTTLNQSGLSAQVTSYYASWNNADKTIAGNARGIGNYQKALASGGSHPWIGLMNTWDTLYLLTMDERAREVSLGNADLAGRLPWYFREADTLAGTGKYFDTPNNGSVDTFGRPVSVNARRTATLSDLTLDCGSQYSGDKINTLPLNSDGWDFYNLGRHHMPETGYVPYLISGRYYYLEQLQLQAAYVVAWKSGCYSFSWQRQGEAGYFNDSETRGTAWAYRTLAYAAFISPDGTPEKAYFEDKLLNNIAKDEGRQDLTLSIPSKLVHWNWGQQQQRHAFGPSPLGIWDDAGPAFVSNPVKEDGSVKSGTSPWMEHFVVASLGMARDFGYPTDNVLKFTAKHMFGQLLHPASSPYLIEGYRAATTLTATNDWIRSWAEVNRYHIVPTGWRVGGDVDHGYGFIALGALSFLYPYSVDSYTGQQAWNFFKAAKPEQNRFATESPKWAILPRP